MSGVPVDVVELILDHLADDKSSLAHCALLSRGTVESARRRLYRAIDYTERGRVTRALQGTLVKNASLASYITVLTWDTPLSFPSHPLPNLRELYINPGRYDGAMGYWYCLSSSTQDTIESLLESPQLKILSVSNFYAFPLYLLSSANLDSLHMESCHPLIVDEWSEELPSPPHKILGNSRVRKFSLVHTYKHEGSDFGTEGWIELLNDDCIYPWVEDITLGLNTYKEPDYLIEYELEAMNWLRRASFVMIRPPIEVPEWVMTLIETLPKQNVLEYLCIDINLGCNIRMGGGCSQTKIANMEWEDVDKTLSLFANLQELHINAGHHHSCRQRLPSDLFRPESTKFPRLLNAGKLSYSETIGRKREQKFYLVKSSKVEKK